MGRPRTGSRRAGGAPSVLWVHHDGERHRLASPAYEPAGWRDGQPRNEVLETIPAASTLAATYTVPDELSAGRYVSRGQFGLSWRIPGQTPGDSGRYPFELLITIVDD